MEKTVGGGAVPEEIGFLDKLNIPPKWIELRKHDPNSLPTQDVPCNSPF